MPFVHLCFVLLLQGAQQRHELGNGASTCGVQAAPVCLPELGWCSGCSTPCKADCLSLSVSLSLSLSLSGAQAEGLECRRLLYLLPTGPDSGLLAGGSHPKAAPNAHHSLRGTGPGARAGPDASYGADADQLCRGQQLAASAPHRWLAGGGRQPLLWAGEGRGRGLSPAGSGDPMDNLFWSLLQGRSGRLGASSSGILPAPWGAPQPRIAFCA